MLTVSRQCPNDFQQKLKNNAAGMRLFSVASYKMGQYIATKVDYLRFCNGLSSKQHTK